MISNSKLMTVLPVNDMQRAKEFYQQKLQLVPEGEHSDGTFVFNCGDAKISLMPVAENPKRDHTALSFEVDNVKDEIASLETRGVKFEDYNMPGLKTVNHIATMKTERAAWFKDTEGNILCLHEDLSH